MGFFRWLFRLGPRIPAHTLGIHDLSGGAADALMAADRAALAPLFRRVSESSDAPPRSTLLLVYCTIGADGGIVNSPRTLREIIRDAGAPVVIVASPNPRRSYGLAVKRQPRLARANLVLTLDRRGTAFDVFPNPLPHHGPPRRASRHHQVVLVALRCNPPIQADRRVLCCTAGGPAGT